MSLKFMFGFLYLISTNQIEFRGKKEKFEDTK
jgi:hypothetical protein